MANKNFNITFEKAVLCEMEDGEIIIREELKDEDVETSMKEVLNMFRGMDGLSISIKHKDTL